MSKVTSSKPRQTVKIEGVEVDLEAELEAAVEAERTKRPVRAKRHGEPTIPLRALTDVSEPSPAPLAASSATEAAPAPSPAPEAPVAAPVAQEPPEAPQAAPPAALPPPRVPTARELAVALTRALRRPEGFDLPREERQRRLTLPAKTQVLGPGDLARFTVALPEGIAGAFQLLTLDFPSFGSSKLIVLDMAIDGMSVWREQGGVSAELFSPPVNVRQNRTPFVVLAASSEVTLVVRNVSPGAVPVHPSITVAALEARG